MKSRSLFPSNRIIGIFRGFSEGGLEFHADLVLPYRSEYQHIPMHGQFLLVQLADENEAVLGRITSLRSDGRLVSPEGEDYSIRMVIENREFPEDLKEQYLKYRVNIRVLGVLRKVNSEEIVFVPSHRRLPHVGSPVAFPSEEVLRHIAGHFEEGADLGFLAMGEFIWAGSGFSTDKRLRTESWMQLRDPAIIVRFPVKNLVSRRTFVFARAGFGKSNLIKLLFSELYKKEVPVVEKRGGRKVVVGTVIFDRDGEYFWPDDKGRPGLCDVPELKDKLVVFTSREAPSPFYGSFVTGKVKLDIRRLPASTVVSIALSPEKQDQQNVRKIKGLPPDKWVELVNLIYERRNSADLRKVKEILELTDGSDAEAIAARSNMTHIVTMLHDPQSRLLDALLTALKDGKLCVLDLSQLSGEAALVISGVILQHIFDYNQREFTTKEVATVPVIAVLEEAQSVLGQGNTMGNAPYVTWVKEGRKYDLGAVMITQQPGSIPDELLSQGDNWFVFHLLSAGDLKAVQKANAHYSEDLLSSLLNEPIPGHCVFWSSVGGKPYPLPVRVLSFEHLYSRLDPDYNRNSEEIYARELKERVESGSAVQEPGEESGGIQETGGSDYYIELRRQCLERIQRDPEFMEDLKRNKSIPWGKVVGILEGYLKELDPIMHNPKQEAYNMVKWILDQILGPEGEEWYTEKRGEKGTTFVVLTKEGLHRLLGEAGEE